MVASIQARLAGFRLAGRALSPRKKDGSGGGKIGELPFTRDGQEREKIP
jgi:hypothetical protein